MTTPFERALGEELAAAAARERGAAERGRPARRLRRVGLAVVAAVLAVAAALALTTSGPATAGIEVTTRAGRVEVLLDADTTPSEIVRAVRAAGFRASTDGVPTGPSKVGRTVGYHADAGLLDLGTPDAHGVRRRGFSLPVGWAGRLVIDVGRAARPGEGYDVSTDAFAVGEALHCSDLRGRPIRAVGHRLDRLAVRVQTADHGIVAPAQLTLEQAQDSDYAGWVVTSASALSATEVLVRIDHDPATPVPHDPTC